MTIDLDHATRFMTSHARLLDRHRLANLLGNGNPEAALAALDAYRNPDGGYGWGLEPDLRAVESQPGGALHAFEVFEEVGSTDSTRVVELCDWLESVTLPDGGLAFAYPILDPAGCAVFWVDADHANSSLHITTAVVAAAHRVARHDRRVADHAWLGRATTYCLDTVVGLDQCSHAIELKFVLDFLDVVSDERPDVVAHIERLGRVIPADGLLHVGGGLEDEMMRPLDLAPLPDRPVRVLFADDVVARELDRLESLQEDDGGWRPDFAAASPVAELEWRGYQTVWAVSVLRANDRI